MPAQPTIGDVVFKHRKSQDLTQDEFGSRYEVSGPAIFKFEKGYVRPSLGLWMRIALDAGLTERRAVLTWLREKIPKKYRAHIDLKPEGARTAKRKGGAIDYRDIPEREDLRKAVEGDKKLPKAFRDALLDEEVWEVFRPVGAEIQIVRARFSTLGKGTPHAHREALRLVREFTHSF